ncbi:hypothetical protein [Xanthomarina sp. F2636L]|uniref:hypothetical protein n=1 Tax=Xanthomarina sp. F2636L TaxID=2996018 RepID=UPI00225E6FC7|nr:hypothetical protein [Xanthomarina sp. F2636L]MCX7551339.1 hypothetical protein [Xanthomarina sp. F2636L]
MKYSYIIFFVLCFLPLMTTSCFDSCDGEEFNFRARIEILMSHRELLELEYTDKNNEKHRVKGNIKGRFVEFCLNKEPLELQFVFQKYKKSEKVTIESLLLENDDNQMFIEKKMFYSYFNSNKSIKYNKEENSYSLLDDSPNHISPILISRKSLKNRLKKRLVL